MAQTEGKPAHTEEPAAPATQPVFLDRWAAVDQYLNGLFAPPDPVLEAAGQASAAAGLPQIQVPPTLGKLLMLLAQAIGARNILEIGTLGGYSTTWLARALPAGGRLITLEIAPEHANVALANLERAGVADRVELRLGPARESLALLAAEGCGPFDLIFIDADKQSYPEYFARSLVLSRRGTVIIADNVVRKGAVADVTNNDSGVQGVRRFLELVSAEPRVSATAIQTVGGKGYDGFAFIRVTVDP